MPTYDYRCKACDFEFEEFQSIAAEPLTICPRCGGPIYRMISGGVGLIFRGSGFYETDYKRKKPAEKPEKTAETAGAPKKASASED
ncbi:MAG TPA: FmdB family zinc ribbon protein [bacterium]|jgi:putative FmdB family regulatory protein